MPVGESIPVPGWLREDWPVPKMTRESLIQLHAAAAVEVLLAITALFVLYLAACRLARGRATRLGIGVVAGVAVLAQLLAVLAPYGFSGDVYSYAIYGRIFAVYGGSPYLDAPIRHAGDPFYDYVYWLYVPSFYGPLWTLISGGIALVAGDDVGLAVLLFRLVEAVSVLAATGLVFVLLRRTDPERALVGAVMLGWCPLVIV